MAQAAASKSALGHVRTVYTIEHGRVSELMNVFVLLVNAQHLAGMMRVSACERQPGTLQCLHCTVVFYQTLSPMPATGGRQGSRCQCWTECPMQ